MNLEALKELAARVEAGTLQDEPYGGMPMLTQFHDHRHGAYPVSGFRDGKAMSAYHGSLDAAKALHEAVLPDHRARLDVGRRFRCWIIFPDNRKLDAYGENSARAWLQAILKALIAQEESK